MPSARMFPHRAEIQVQTGTSGEGEPLFEEAVGVRCLMSPGLRRVETQGGREEVSTMTAYCERAAPDVPTGSRLTYQGRDWTVVRSLPWRFPGRPHLECVEVHLQ